MAQSTTNLGKIHVFPSETLYNQFKDIIADNDLALLKDDGAYIVAALLEQNGYVKFSNGLILQWGYTGNQSNKITFPLRYPKSVLGIMVTTGDGIPQNPVDVTLSGATAANYNGTGYKTYWLAYGI